MGYKYNCYIMLGVSILLLLVSRIQVDALQRPAQAIKQINGVWEITTDVEIPESTKLKIGKNASIIISNGKRLTIRGQIEAPSTHLFSGGGEVVIDSDNRVEVYPQWWGATGNGTNNDSKAVQAAINSFSAKGGVIRFPEGTYLIGNVGMKSNISLIGNGPRSILKQKSGSACCITTKTSNAGIDHRRNYTATPGNILFSGLTFRGSVDTDGFSEFIMLLRLEAVHDVTVQNCQFIGFRGDGVYVGASDTSLHNSNIRITGCLFDGINRDNRNGISIIDGTDVTIRGCEFRNIARYDMPGAIDLEPDYPANIIRNIIIDGNRFSDMGGGNIIQVSVNIFVLKLNVPLQNITITNNQVSGSGSNNGIYVAQQYQHTRDTPVTNVVIRGNRVTNTQRAFMLWGLKQVVLQDNIFDGCELSPYISSSEKNVNVMDMKIVGNTFRNLSQSDGLGIFVFGTDGLEISDNVFDNIGKRDGTAGSSLSFKHHGAPALSVTIRNNIFKGARTKTAIQRDRYQVTEPEKNIIRDNDFGGMKSLLPAKQI